MWKINSHVIHCFQHFKMWITHHTLVSNQSLILRFRVLTSDFNQNSCGFDVFLLFFPQRIFGSAKKSWTLIFEFYQKFINVSFKKCVCSWKLSRDYSQSINISWHPPPCSTRQNSKYSWKTKWKMVLITPSSYKLMHSESDVLTPPFSLLGASGLQLSSDLKACWLRSFT